jgi:flagellar basal-body rod protein FlgF
MSKKIKLTNLSALSLAFLIILYDKAFASNSIYINLSNYVTKNLELQTISNNIANQDTIGFEEDNMLSATHIKKMKSRQSNSFVAPKAIFLTKEPGAIDHTNRNLDVTIIDDGYFKILTPRGFRYTLDGSIQLNNDGILVTKNGYPYLDQDNQQIALEELGDTNRNVYINSAGAIFANQEEIGRLGVFFIADKTKLIKEGNGLYRAQINDTIIEDVKLLTGALRKSNVNPNKNMTNIMEINNSIKATNSLISDIFTLEKRAIEKIIK